jgi:hypothetical protein
MWLQNQQLPDGGFGAGATSSQALTADVTYALALLGENVTGSRWTTPGGKNPLDALRSLAIPSWVQADPGQAGKVTRAVVAAGADPRSFGGVDLVATIQGFYDPSTGLYHPGFVFRHAVAIEGLLLSGAPVPQAAYDALLARQLADGGWTWNLSLTASDVDTTGEVLKVLAGMAQVAAPDSYESAGDWLIAVQRPEGGWNTAFVLNPSNPPDPPNANSTALAIAGLKAAGYDLTAPEFLKNGNDPLASLLSFQEASGAFVFEKTTTAPSMRMAATADVLITLAPVVLGEQLCGCTYLPLILAR